MKGLKNLYSAQSDKFVTLFISILQIYFHSAQSHTSYFSQALQAVPVEKNVENFLKESKTRYFTIVHFAAKMIHIMWRKIEPKILSVEKNDNMRNAHSLLDWPSLLVPTFVTNLWLVGWWNMVSTSWC